MNRMLYCSECCTKKGGRQNKWQKIQTGMEYRLQLMQQLGRQSTAAPLSLPEQLQIVADGWGADAPVDGLQDSKLSQLELLNTDVKQGAEFSRVGNGTIDNVFEALLKEAMSFLIESARCAGEVPRAALQRRQTVVRVGREWRCRAVQQGCRWRRGGIGKTTNMGRHRRGRQ